MKHIFARMGRYAGATLLAYFFSVSAQAKDYPPPGPEDPDTLPIAELLQPREMEGPLIIGRRYVNAPDYPILTSELAALAKLLTGKPPSTFKPGPDEDTGRVLCDLESGKPVEIQISEDLSPGSARRVLAHHIGYALNLLASGEFLPGTKERAGIPMDGIERELRINYDVYVSGEVRSENLYGPEDDGITGIEAQRYLLAAAFRTYLTNPNAMKTFAPETAKRIRAYVNGGHTGLNKIIWFN